MEVVVVTVPDCPNAPMLERRLAQRVQGSGTIHFMVRQFITRALAAQHRLWLALPGQRGGLRADGTNASRYSYFYSKGISAVIKSAQRSLDEGLQYIIANDSSTTVMAAAAAMACFSARILPLPVGGTVLGMSNMVVTPPNAAPAVPLPKSSLWV